MSYLWLTTTTQFGTEEGAVVATRTVLRPHRTLGFLVAFLFFLGPLLPSLLIFTWGLDPGTATCFAILAACSWAIPLKVPICVTTWRFSDGTRDGTLRVRSTLLSPSRGYEVPIFGDDGVIRLVIKDDIGEDTLVISLTPSEAGRGRALENKYVWTNLHLGISPMPLPSRPPTAASQQAS